MVARLYVIFDRVAEESMPVFEARNDGVALRNYSASMAKASVPASEFQLLCVGSIDHDTSVVTAFGVPEEVIASVSKGVDDNGV